MTQDIDVEKMEWGGTPVRRSVSNTVPTLVEFWNDDAWQSFDSYSQCMLATAIAAGRDRVAIHMQSTYDIDLTELFGVSVDDDEKDDDDKDDEKKDLHSKGDSASQHVAPRQQLGEASSSSSAPLASSVSSQFVGRKRMRCITRPH